MIILMLGPPGAGKGTIAQRINSEFGFPQLSSGDLLRNLANSNSKIAQQVKLTLADGRLVNDELITELIEEEVEGKEYSKGFTLDGYPRNLKQIFLLDRVLAKHDKKLDLVLHLQIEDELIMKRITSRRTCPKCNAIYGMNFPPKEAGICDKCHSLLFQREDDKEDTVKNRLETYNSLTSPLIEHYAKKGMLKSIDASQDIEEVMKQV
ncbi:MAG: adenylate kinase, partial [Candidatus Diapherotrites archaeon]|nr:adenylate kinase [Candidatus Diapherotrites archaeon]